MRTTIYLPDDLNAAARRMQINVSEVCARALRDAIVNRKQELQASIELGERARQLLHALEQDPAEEVPTEA